MDFKKTDAQVSTITRDIVQLASKTGNIYESIVICSKLSDQINAEMREELYKKLEEFATYSDSLEEIHENREQIEVSKYYEKLPKATLIAVEEFLKNKVFYKRQETNQHNDL